MNISDELLRMIKREAQIGNNHFSHRHFSLETALVAVESAGREKAMAAQSARKNAASDMPNLIRTMRSDSSASKPKTESRLRASIKPMIFGPKRLASQPARITTKMSGANRNVNVSVSSQTIEIESNKLKGSQAQGEP